MKRGAAPRGVAPLVFMTDIPEIPPRSPFSRLSLCLPERKAKMVCDKPASEGFNLRTPLVLSTIPILPLRILGWRDSGVSSSSCLGSRRSSPGHCCCCYPCCLSLFPAPPTSARPPFLTSLITPSSISGSVSDSPRSLSSRWTRTSKDFSGSVARPAYIATTDFTSRHTVSPMDCRGCTQSSS